MMHHHSWILAIKQLYLHHLLFGILHRFGHIIDGLVLGNGIFLLASLCRFKFTQFRFTRQCILQLTNRRQKCSSEGLEFAVLATNADLDCKPETLEKQTLKGNMYIYFRIYIKPIIGILLLLIFQYTRQAHQVMPIQFLARTVQTQDWQTMEHGPEVRDKHLALGYVMASMDDEYTELSGIHERQVQLKSREKIKVQQRDEGWSQCNLGSVKYYK